jgi:hypothetical protein
MTKFIIHCEKPLALEEMAAAFKSNKVKFTLLHEPGMTILDVPEMKMKGGRKAWLLKKMLETQLKAALLAKGANIKIEVKE